MARCGLLNALLKLAFYFAFQWENLRRVESEPANCFFLQNTAFHTGILDLFERIDVIREIVFVQFQNRRIIEINATEAPLLSPLAATSWGVMQYLFGYPQRNKQQCQPHR